MRIPFFSPPLRRLVPQHGFTLTELMVVVAIIGICAAMAIPSYDHWLARTELRNAAVLGQSQLAFTKMTARNRNTPLTVTWATTGTVITVTTTDAAGLTIGAPLTLSSRVVGLAVMDSAGVYAPTGQITFSSLGLRSGGPLGQTQGIQLTNSKGLTYGLTVNPGGRIHWCPQATCL